MIKPEIAIVVVTYNRSESLIRLLNSLSNSNYTQEYTLIISIDYSNESDSESLYKIANEFRWDFGQKKIIQHEKNLGLREHILQCGDLTSVYDAVIIFEDDIIPAKDFTSYVSQALQFYQHEKKVAGISLYNPEINEMAELPFEPVSNNFDAYLIQSVSSWGQCWSSDMWIDFRNWYDKNDGTLEPMDDLPDTVYNWSEKSWKKYFMKYLVVTDKYFLFPYKSLSTNNSEIGTHVSNKSTRYQVALQYLKNEYKFPMYSESIRYDAFFENINLIEHLEQYFNVSSDVSIDLYSTKNKKNLKRYVLSTDLLNYKIVDQFGLELKPIEMNILLGNKGSGIFLYDTFVTEQNESQNNNYDKLEYFSNITPKQALKFSLQYYLNKYRKK